MPSIFRPATLIALALAAPLAAQTSLADRLTSLARSGDAAAMVELGQAYAEGSGVPQSYGDAMRWYREAADKGHPAGMRLLGALYNDGKGVSKDYAEALKWFSAAAAKGDAAALWYLGMAHSFGRGVPVNYVEGVRWFRQSAAKDHPDGLNSLGVMYSLGNGISQDKAEAMRLFEKAADGGSASALTNMAVLYEKGEGVAANLTAADGLRAAFRRGADPRQWRAYLKQAQALAPATLVAPEARPAAPAPSGHYASFFNRGSTRATLYQDGKQICVLAPGASCGEIFVPGEPGVHFNVVTADFASATFFRQYGREVPAQVCIKPGPIIEGC